MLLTVLSTLGAGSQLAQTGMVLALSGNWKLALCLRFCNDPVCQKAVAFPGKHQIAERLPGHIRLGGLAYAERY